MKKLNISLNVRRMEAQNILTTSLGVGAPVTEENKNDMTPQAATRGGNAGSVPVRAGF